MSNTHRLYSQLWTNGIELDMEQKATQLFMEHEIAFIFLFFLSTKMRNKKSETFIHSVFFCRAISYIFGHKSYCPQSLKRTHFGSSTILCCTISTRDFCQMSSFLISFFQIAGCFLSFQCHSTIIFMRNIKNKLKTMFSIFFSDSFASNRTVK